jgi:hypothetical protein
MKRVILTFAAVVICTLTASAQHQTERVAPLQPYDVLVVKGNVGVILLRCDSVYLTALGSGAAVKRLNVKQRNDKLVLNNRCFANDEKVFVYLPVSALRFVRLEQGAYIVCADEIDVDSLFVMALDNSRMELKTNARSVKVWCEPLSQVFVSPSCYFEKRDEQNSLLHYYTCK